MHNRHLHGSTSVFAVSASLKSLACARCMGHTHDISEHSGYSVIQSVRDLLRGSLAKHCLTDVVCLAQAAVDALTYVEQSMALVPLFDGTDLHALQAAAELKTSETAEDGAVRRRLTYADEDQGVLSSHLLR